MYEKIQKYFGDEAYGVKIHYIIEDEPLGTLNAIRLGMEALPYDCQCLIRNGDIVSDINIRKMIEEGEKSQYPISMFITRMKSPYGIVEINGDRLVSFKEKPLLDAYINGGIYFTKGKLDFGDFKTGDIEKTFFPLIAKENNLGYYKEDGLFWMAIGTNKELETIKKEYIERTDKPWGYEKILIFTEKYLTKELYIREGYQTSFHYRVSANDIFFFFCC